MHIVPGKGLKSLKAERQKNTTMTTNDLTQAKNDVYGNPRVIVHFSSLLTDKENNELSIDAAYNLAHKRALKLGGKIYRGKDIYNYC